MSKRTDATHEPGTPEPPEILASLDSATHKPRPRRWPRIIGISISVLLVLSLLAAGGVGVFGYAQYPTLTALSIRFCSDLRTQTYGDAYQMLSARMHARYSRDTFISMAQTLDTFQGNIESCAQPGLSRTQVGLFPLSLTIPSTLTRQNSGAHQGTVRLVYEQGSWKVDDLSSSLLGINPDALAVALVWCDRASHNDYVGVWSLYSQALQGQDPKSAVEQLPAQPPTGAGLTPLVCTLTALRSSSDQRSISVTFEITNTSQVVQATIGQDHGQWRMIAVSPDTLGQLIAANAVARPVTTVANEWLQALASGDCSGAYALLAADAQQRISLATFTSQVCLAWNWYAVVSEGIYTQSAAQTSIKIEFRGWLPGATPTRILGINAVVVHPTAQIILIQEQGSWKVEALRSL